MSFTPKEIEEQTADFVIEVMNVLKECYPDIYQDIILKIQGEY